MKCPECGAELIKRPKGGIYECPNPNCPVIKVRVHGAGKWIGDITVHYDSTAKPSNPNEFTKTAISRLRQVETWLLELSGRLHRKGMTNEAELLLGCTTLLDEAIERLEKKSESR